jgi:DNA-binding transcriptional regulator YiaG
LQVIDLRILSLIYIVIVMAVANRDDRAEKLLEQLQSRRQLPVPAERKRIREAAGVSLRQLAAAIPPSGVSPMAIVRWEAGATPREAAHLRGYSRLLQELRHFEEKREPDLGRAQSSRVENVDGKPTAA